MDMFLTMAGIGFCTKTANIWQIVGYVLLVFKVAIPILLIIFGIIDLGKAVIASKEDEIKKATGSLVRRAIAAVVIFLLPTIVTFVMGIVSDFNSDEVQDDFKVCRSCISSPSDSDCDGAADTAWKGGESSSGASDDNGR